MSGHDQETMHGGVILPSPLFRGEVIDAVYSNQVVPSFQGNPLIEALPVEYATDKDVAKALRQTPVFTPELRQLSARDRIHCTGDLEDQFFHPLPMHLTLQLKISRMFRRGYVMRNPLTPGFYPRIQTALDTIPSFTSRIRGPRRPKALGFNLIGPSGIGKSYSLEAILSLFPQVIRHSSYQGVPFAHLQLGWLKLDCPFDASLKALSIGFFEAVDALLGTNYTQAYTRSRMPSVDDLLRDMARIAAIHFLGGLVIDEIQVLRAMRSERSELMLNFFVNLVNTIGVPVLLVGTDKARTLFEGKPRQARRGTGQGSEVWYLMRYDVTWTLFLRALFKYQYVQHTVKLTDEISQTFFEETQGITDLVVKLYVQTQIRAMRTGHETITPQIVRSVALDSFQMLRPVIMALRKGDKRALAELEDIYPFWREEYARMTQGEDEPIEVRANPPQEPADSSDDSQGNAPVSTPSGNIETPTDEAVATRPKTPRRSRSANKHAYPSGSLMAIVQEGRKQQITPYDALKQASYIFSLNDYLTEADGVAQQC